MFTARTEHYEFIIIYILCLGYKAERHCCAGQPRAPDGVDAGEGTLDPRGHVSQTGRHLPSHPACCHGTGVEQLPREVSVGFSSHTKIFIQTHEIKP